MAHGEMMEYAYFEGNIVPFSEANISIGTHAMQYGTGAFAGIRGYRSADGNAINIVRATVAALQQLEEPEAVAARRGLPVEDVAPAPLLRAQAAGRAAARAAKAGV